MSVQTIKIVEQNTAPPIILTLTRTDGTIIDLTNTTVQLIITSSGVQTNSAHPGATVLSPASAGKISYQPQTGDIPTAGTYICDALITYSDNSQEVVYDQLKIKARLRATSSS